MESNNLTNYQKHATPPQWALKEIKGGNLKGMTDIKPQWRYEALTELYGPCGNGWHYTIDKLWLENDGAGNTAAFALISLFTGPDSKAIPGIGGSAFTGGNVGSGRISDECYKMAVTDALSVACKVIGIGSDVYAGKMGKVKPDTKYGQQPAPAPKKATKDEISAMRVKVLECTTKEQLAVFKPMIKEMGKPSELTEAYNYVLDGLKGVE